MLAATHWACCGVSTRSARFHCSCAVNCIAAYGMMRAMVALLPLHSATTPSCFALWMRKLIAARQEYGVCLENRDNYIKLFFNGNH